MKRCHIIRIFAQNINGWYTLELPQGCGSNEYTLSMFKIKFKKIIFATVNTSFTVEYLDLLGSRLYDVYA